jgi:hypothetical protein
MKKKHDLTCILEQHKLLRFHGFEKNVFFKTMFFHGHRMKKPCFFSKKNMFSKKHVGPSYEQLLCIISYLPIKKDPKDKCTAVQAVIRKIPSWQVAVYI